jgi:ribosomal-protein-alanine N-acetyltransferase
VVDLIETERLRLRPFAADLSDLDALHEIQSDPHHMRFYPHPFSREESRAWIEKFVERQERDGYSLWAIEDRETGAFLGNCGPAPNLFDALYEFEFVWSVRTRPSRMGIATEAAGAWRDRCLGSLGMDHVISLIRPDNVPSRGVAEHIGMTVWKETHHGSLGWLHLVYRIDAADRVPTDDAKRGS